MALLKANTGIGTSNPSSALHVIGDGLFTGIITATSFSGNLTGTASSVALNSVGLGTNTYGDYVRDITGTANQITVTGGTGEGSTPTLSIPNQFTAPQDIEVTRDLQVNRNLNVNGNITIGGTAATLFTNELKIYDPDIVLGFRTDAFGNDVSNDNTANHGGVAVASTEGNPLVQLFIAGIETTPATYKKIMWFKAGEFSGLGTDAWLSNYAVGIGSTQFPVGTRLASGSVQFTQNDLAVVRNINASGVVTASSFNGNASSSTYAPNAGVATYATISGIATYAPNAGVSTYASNAGLATEATYATNAGLATEATYATNAGVSTYATNAGVATYASASGVSTSVIGGIASVTQLSVSGVSTFSNNVRVSGIVTANSVLVSNDGGKNGSVLIEDTGAYSQITFRASNGTDQTQIQGVEANLYVLPGGTGYIGLADATTNLFYPNGNVILNNGANGTTTLGNGVQITGLTSTTSLRVGTGGTVINATATGSVGIGTTNPTSKLHVIGDTRIVGTVTATSFVGDGSQLTGISGGVSISTNTTNQAQFLTYVISTGSTTGFGVTTTGLVFNPSTTRLGIGTTNPTETLQVVGDSNIANRTSYRSAPGDLFSFPGTENEIQFPGQNYEIITVGVASDIASNLNNKYFTIYGPGGTSSSISVTAAEQNVVVWFNVAGAGSTPAVVGAGRSVGIAITSGASAISVGNSITTQMSSDAGFTVATSGDGNVVFVPKTPQNFSAPTVGTAGTVGFAVTTTQDGSGILSGSSKWSAGVLAPNGKIYGIPLNSTSVLVIDPATGITTTFGSLSGTGKWAGGVLAPNGKIYGIPRDSSSVLVIDPAVGTATTFGSVGGSSSKWWGGVLAPNGKIYGIPFNNTSVLVIDPVTNTTSTFGSFATLGNIPPSDILKWWGGVLAPNGKIYAIPRSSSRVLVIDPATNTTSTFGSLGNADGKWNGGVLAPNGKIYGIPYNSTSVLVIDPVVGTATTFGSLSGDSNKWWGGVLAPNGKIYGIPYDSTSILVIDPAVGTATTFGSLSGGSKWWGGVLAPNGKIYGIPNNSTSVLSIGGGSAAIPDWYLSAYQNKY